MKVLLTRRLEDSERTASKLKTVGLEPVILPLFEIEQTGNGCPDTDPDFVMFTSAAAVEHAEWGSGEAACKALPCYAVGPRTTEHLAAHGYRNIRQGEGTAADLADRIAEDFKDKNAHGLYVCGETRAYDFAKRFEDSSISLTLWETYRINPVEFPEEVLEHVLNALNGGIIMLFSPNSAERLMTVYSGIASKNSLSKCRFVAISRNCADRLPRHLQENVTISQTPDETGMIAAAQAIACE